MGVQLNAMIGYFESHIFHLIGSYDTESLQIIENMAYALLENLDGSLNYPHLCNTDTLKKGILRNCVAQKSPITFNMKA